MKSSKLVVIVVVIIAVAGGAWLIFGNNKSTPSTTSSSTSSNMSSSSANTAPTATNGVTIQNFAFSPAAITIKKGTTVTWTNQDSTAHTVTETDGKTGPASGDLNQGSTYTFTYNTVGSFAYHCSIHPDMTGTVTVTE